MPISPDTPFLFNPHGFSVPLPAHLPQRDEDEPQVLSAVNAAGRRLTPTDRAERNRAALDALPAGEPAEPANGEDGSGFGDILRSALPAALFGLGTGASIRQGNVAPLMRTATGFLSGLGEREQREAKAAAAAREEARLQALADSLIAQRRRAAQPEIQFSRGGFTGSFVPEPVPETIFGQELTPGGREQAERQALEKGLATLETAFSELPVERFGRPVESRSGEFFQHSPDTGEMTPASGSPKPMIGPINGRYFPDTPEGHAESEQWKRRMGAAGRRPGSGDGDDTADKDLNTLGEQRDFALSQLYELAEVIDDEDELRRNLVQRLKNLDFKDAPARALAANAMDDWRSERRTQTRFEERRTTGGLDIEFSPEDIDAIRKEYQ